MYLGFEAPRPDFFVPAPFVAAPDFAVLAADPLAFFLAAPFFAAPALA